MINTKSLRIRLDKIDGFSWTDDETRYLVLLAPEKYNAISNKIRNLISLKVASYICFFSFLCKNQI